MNQRSSIELTIRSTHRTIVIMKDFVGAIEPENEGCIVITAIGRFHVEEKKAEILKLLGCINVTTKQGERNGKTSF